MDKPTCYICRHYVIEPSVCELCKSGSRFEVITQADVDREVDRHLLFWLTKEVTP